MARTPSKPSKPHVPYRGDDYSVGKKTGIKVGRVQRTADGYERFDDILSQANTRAPPRRKKKSVPRVSDGGEEEEDDEEDDEYEEASMDVESPVHYSTTPRATTSARPVSRGAAVDFDAVPSPRTTRKPVSHAEASRVARELLEQDDDDDEGGMDNYDQHDDYAGGEEDEPVQTPKGKGKGKATAPQALTSKGKGRALPPVEEEEDEMEDDIARGMDDVDQAGSDEDEEEEEEERTPPKKRAKGTPAPTTKPKQVRSRMLKENRNPPEGVRRSQRMTYTPLDYWRGEKVEYGPREPGHKRLVPHIAQIIRIPKEPPAPRPGIKRKRGRARTKTTPDVVEREVIVEVDASNPEAGWDDDTNPTAIVLDYRTGDNVTRRVAFTSKMFDPRPAKVAGADDAWSFEKIFGDGDFMAAGQLVIPARKRKPAKGTKDNTYIFFVVEGAVNVVVCDTSVILATGGMFMVPRGNSYFIENIADRDAKLFFTQARKMREDEDEEGATARAPRGISVAMGGGVRSGSDARSGSRP
ncbi:Mif2/CENP-C like-domain-containing protein [Mycena vitilis]|nr:Mif2/CENP-C like-domain-containing protein [Mycena vitilis]